MARTSPGRALATALLVLAAVVALGEPPRAAAQDTMPGDGLMIILDSSGSMVAQAGNGQARFEAARAALGELVSALPQVVNVGLTVYGHRIGSDDSLREQGCADIEVVVPMAPLDRGRLQGAIDTVNPSGYTPIGGALLQATAELDRVGGRKTIVLVSDGIDTCAPPAACDVAAGIREDGFDVTVETVGFQVDEAARAELECIAEATGGSYRDAPDAAALADSVQDLSSRSFRAYLPVGAAISGGTSAGAATALGLGNHVDAVGPGQQRWYDFEIPTGQDFFVTATMVGDREQPLSGTGTLTMEVYPEGGQDPCGAFSARVTDAVQPTSVAVGGGVTREDSCTTGPFVAGVEFTADDQDVAYPMEVGLFLTEPNTALAPPGFRDSAVDASVVPVGGASHTLAPLVQPGDYRDSIRAGERQIWAIEVPRGQSLRVDVDVPPAEVPIEAETVVGILMQNGARQSDPDDGPDATLSQGVSTMSGGSVSLTTAPVGQDPLLREFLRLPGVFFVNVTIDNVTYPTSLIDYDLRLTLVGDDDATTGPTSTGSTTPPPPASEASAAPSDAAATPSNPPGVAADDAGAVSTDPFGGLSLPALVGLGLLALVLTAGLVMFVLRNQR